MDITKTTAFHENSYGFGPCEGESPLCLGFGTEHTDPASAEIRVVVLCAPCYGARKRRCLDGPCENTDPDTSWPCLGFGTEMVDPAGDPFAADTVVLCERCKSTREAKAEALKKNGWYQPELTDAEGRNVWTEVTR